MKSKNIFTRDKIEEIVDLGGSVQKVSWLTDDEKAVFKTAFELNQNILLRYSALRNKWICQWQSVNLFIPSDTPEETISELHEDLFNNENILGSYYIYTKSGYIEYEEFIRACIDKNKLMNDEYLKFAFNFFDAFFSITV